MSLINTKSFAIASDAPRRSSTEEAGDFGSFQVQVLLAACERHALLDLNADDHAHFAVLVRTAFEVRWLTYYLSHICT